MSIVSTTPTLVSSSSTLSSSVASVPPHPPILNRSDPLDRLEDLYYNNQLTPPKAANGKSLHSMEQAANQLLANLSSQWASLSGLQKSMLSFLLLNSQDVLLQQRFPQTWTEMLNNSLDLEKVEGKRLHPFVVSGGDSKDSPDEHPEYLKLFLEHFPRFKDWETGPTIFNNPDSFKQVQPFGRFQREISMVCYIVSAANLILYFMSSTTGTKGDEAVLQYAINVGRYMRNHLAQEQIFGTVFCGHGGYPEDILDELLENGSIDSSDRKKSKTGVFSLMKKLKPETICDYIKNSINETGPLLVEGFRPFDDYLNTSTLFFGGNYHKKKVSATLLDARHAFLIVGVTQTGSKDDEFGGVAFMVQDSLEGRPFVTIGWDLLSSMDVTKFRHIESGVVFAGTTFEQQLDDANSETITKSGSSTAGTMDGTPEATDASGQEEGKPYTRPDWLGNFNFEIPKGADLSKFFVYT